MPPAWAALPKRSFGTSLVLSCPSPLLSTGTARGRPGLRDRDETRTSPSRGADVRAPSSSPGADFHGPGASARRGQAAEWPSTPTQRRPIPRRDISRRVWRRRSLQRKIQLMTMRSTSAYPELSSIAAGKAEGRRELASRSFAEKAEMPEALRARFEPIRKAGEARCRPGSTASQTRGARDKRIKSTPTPFPRGTSGPSRPRPHFLLSSRYKHFTP